MQLHEMHEYNEVQYNELSVIEHFITSANLNY